MIMALRSRRSQEQVPSIDLDKLEGEMTDAELIDHAMDWRREIAGNNGHRMCAMVSWPLQGFLECMGVECECETLNFMEINHVVIRLADGRILDATADQFGLPGVYLGRMPRKYQRWMREHARFVEQSHACLNAAKAKRAVTPAASEAP